MTNLGKVLLVDDDAVSNFISMNMLRLMNAAVQITVTEDRCQALELIAEEPFDLILLEKNTACTDGFGFLDTLKQLQEITDTAAPAVVILAASESHLDEAIAERYPVKGYLTKPLTQGQVNHLIALLS